MTIMIIQKWLASGLGEKINQIVTLQCYPNGYIGLAMKLSPHSKVLNRIEALGCNCDMTKAQVRKIACDAATAGVVTNDELADVSRILADKSQCAEDALSELRDSVLTRHPSF